MMKKYFLAVCFLSFTLAAFGQFKDSGFHSDDVDQSIVNNNSNSLFGFLNPNNFIMKQSYDMSYSSSGGQGLALGVYTNDMMYKFSNNLNVELGASVVNAPYSTLGSAFQKSINGIYLNNASINYRPWKDVSISLQYRNMPFGYYSPYSFYNGFGNGFYNGFDSDPFNNK
jgi:hypothetical protein